MINQTLESLECRLGPDFFRANRQAIVHKEAIEYVAQHHARKLKLVLNFPFEEELVVSKANATNFLSWFEFNINMNEIKRNQISWIPR